MPGDPASPVTLPVFQAVAAYIGSVSRPRWAGPRSRWSRLGGANTRSRRCAGASVPLPGPAPPGGVPAPAALCRLRAVGPGVRAPTAGLVVGKGGEGLLGVAVPTHRLLRVPPTALHGVAGLPVSGVAGLLRLLEVAVLGLDDVVRALAVVLQVAGAPEGPAGHGLHGRLLLLRCTAVLTIETSLV